ncbi:MAG: UvrD-helicase domain-containing protein [Bacilli bacterium]
MEEYFKNMLKKIDSNIILDQQQIEVIKDESKSLIVIAGAGAGKTTTMTAKVKYLIEKKGICQKDILVISYTNKAVNELKYNINEILNFKIDILTFHKFALETIKRTGKKVKIIEKLEPIIREIIKNENKRELSRNVKFLLKKEKNSKKIEKYNNNLDFFVASTVENICFIRTSDIDLKDIIKNTHNKKIKDYLKFLLNIIEKYKSFMYDNNSFDFDELIYYATNLVNEKNNNYKYIIIDEYQDISQIRLNLIKKLKEKSNIIVVGDDWQSIYSFSGSNVKLFLDFKKEFNAKIIKLENTYRNSQELINIAGNFVMKDDKLIKKNLISFKRNTLPLKLYIYKKNLNSCLKKIIEEIIRNYGEEKNILILGRYKNDINMLNKELFNINEFNIAYIRNEKIKIDFLTIHSSKGLGYDNVILLFNDLKSSKFPSDKKNNFFKSKVLKIKKDILEERRLFYVAMTRTKNDFYIIVDSKNKSLFVKEIKKEAFLSKMK